jgi:hypothetical protein
MENRSSVVGGTAMLAVLSSLFPSRAAGSTTFDGDVHDPDAESEYDPRSDPKRMKRGDFAQIVKNGPIGKDGRPHSTYRNFFIEDLHDVLRYRFSDRVPNGQLSSRKLMEKYGIPNATIDRYVKKMSGGLFEKAHKEAYPLATRALWLQRVDDPRQYIGENSQHCTVPKDIEQLLVDLIKWADSSEIKCQFTQQEAAYYLCGMLEDRGVELPQYWKDNGGPSSGWWQDFYKKHPELVKGQANRLAEVRVTAHTPAAIKDWFNRIITGEGSKDKFYGMNPKGMEKYLIEQLPHICAEHDNDPQWIKARAKALCHDPRLQTNFDQVVFRPHPVQRPVLQSREPNSGCVCAEGARNRGVNDHHPVVQVLPPPLPRCRGRHVVLRVPARQRERRAPLHRVRAEGEAHGVGSVEGEPMGRRVSSRGHAQDHG